MQAVPTVPGWHPVGPATTPAAYWHCAVCPAPTYGAHSVPTLCTLCAHSPPHLVCAMLPQAALCSVSVGVAHGAPHTAQFTAASATSDPGALC